MFLVPTFVAPSDIHGFGVFTPEPLAAGAIIWRFRGGVDLRLTREELDRLPSTLAPTLRSYCYREEAGTYVLCGDAAKFMNHSENPTCDDDGEVTTVRRDLGAGAELTCDYRTFDWDIIEGREEWFVNGVTPQEARLSV